MNFIYIFIYIKFIYVFLINFFFVIIIIIIIIIIFFIFNFDFNETIKICVAAGNDMQFSFPIELALIDFHDFELFKEIVFEKSDFSKEKKKQTEKTTNIDKED